MTKKILIIGAHPDDIELGMAGTICRHVSRGDSVFALILTNGDKSGNSKTRRKEASNSAEHLGITRIYHFRYRDAGLKADYRIVDRVRTIITEHDIDRIYTHSENDIHPDHTAANSIVLFASRRVVNEIFFFESPSTTHFKPTYFVNITRHLHDKIKALQSFRSIDRRYMEQDEIRNKALFRGQQCNIRYAEGFEVFRLLEHENNTGTSD